MSTSSSSKWPCQPSRFSFQYFDEASDVGLENESGERVRKRKRPGRKPNPPSIQERRAQNRAAQRAFREREQQRRQEKERQWRALVEERDRLKERLAQVEYEANYLRGCLLLFSLSSLVERGTVPHIWTDTRVLPIPWNGAKTLDSIHDKPAILQTLLDPKNHILDFRKALANAQINGCAIAKAPRFNNGTSNTLALKTNPLPAFATSIPATTTTTTTTTTTESYHDDDTSTLKTNPLLLPRQSHEDLSAPTESMVSSFTATQPVLGTITETPTLKTPDDLAHMPPLQALHILRLQLKTSNILGDKIRTAFAPSKYTQDILHRSINDSTRLFNQPPCNASYRTTHASTTYRARRYETEWSFTKAYTTQTSALSCWSVKPNLSVATYTIKTTGWHLLRFLKNTGSCLIICMIFHATGTYSSFMRPSTIQYRPRVNLPTIIITRTLLLLLLDLLFLFIRCT